MKGIYIHIPFCLSKCPYCDFTSFENGDKKRYIKALIKEMKIYGGLHSDKIDTVFFGGGTPTEINSLYIETVLKTLYETLNIKKNAEITIEANPKTVDKQKLVAYKKSGINRISFGLQSVNDKELLTLGRVHTYREFEKSYELARSIGFDNINLDLMFGLPNQQVSDFKKSIDKVIKLNPEHVSCYGLKIEKGTKFYRDYYGSVDMPCEKAERKMYHLASEIFKENGYNHYETSNFAKEGMECEHNLIYWRCHEYLGFGVSAHSYFIDEKEHVRQSNTSDMDKYILDIENDVLPIDEKEILTKKDIEEEFIMLNLRLSTGIDFNEFENKFGYSFKDKFDMQIKSLEENGMIIKSDKGIYPTLKGFDLQNTMITMFL